MNYSDLIWAKTNGYYEMNKKQKNVDTAPGTEKQDQKRLAQMAALVALGVSVGMTTNVSAKSPADNMKMTKEVDAKELKADKKKLRTQEKIQTRDKISAPVPKLKTGGPPPP